MSKKIFSSVLISLFGLALVAAAVIYAEEQMPYGKAYETSEIIGSSVSNSQGEYLGRIRDLVVDSSGGVAFVVLGHDGFLGFGEKLNTVPFGALSYDTAKNRLVADISKEKLESAPAFDRKAIENRQSAAPALKGYERTYEVRDIIGSTIVNPQGHFLGRIDELIIDSNGRVDFAVLSQPGPYGYNGLSGRQVAVPFRDMTYDLKENRLVLDVSRCMLQDAPSFKRTDMTKQAWVEDTYRYFGQQPYWTEGGSCQALCAKACQRQKEGGGPERPFREF